MLGVGMEAALRLMSPCDSSATHTCRRDGECMHRSEREVHIAAECLQQAVRDGGSPDTKEAYAVGVVLMLSPVLWAGCG